MKERSILFTGEMVRAILAGQKTQTRRVIKVDPKWELDMFAFENPVGTEAFNAMDTTGKNLVVKCPYGKPGDRLWVRENWAVLRDEDECSIQEITEMNAAGPPSLFYCDTADHTAGRWRPSIHMPRWASRLNLVITDVCVQRIQSIDYEDTRKEGDPWWGRQWPTFAEEKADLASWYRNLWDKINAKRGFGWDANPWVWVVEFEVVK